MPKTRKKGLPFDAVGDQVLLQKQRRVPGWAVDLATLYSKAFVKSAPIPSIVFVQAPSPSHFCGRHFPRENVLAICQTMDPALTRGVLVHELTHWRRKYQGDPNGKHDGVFLACVKRAYEFFEVPRSVQKAIDPELFEKRVR